MEINEKFGDWTVVELGRYDKRPGALVRCKCGRERWHTQKNLVAGRTTKCRQCSYDDRGPLLAKRIHGEHLAAKDKFSDYKTKAKQRGVEWGLDFDTFLAIAKMNCRYCDQEPSNVNRLPNKEWADDFVYNGIDRLVNSQGYFPWNVLPCCKYCNYMKRELSYSEFIERVAKIAENHPRGSVLQMSASMYAKVDS